MNEDDIAAAAVILETNEEDDFEVDTQKKSEQARSSARPRQCASGASKKEEPRRSTRSGRASDQISTATTSEDTQVKKPRASRDPKANNMEIVPASSEAAGPRLSRAAAKKAIEVNKRIVDDSRLGTQEAEAVVVTETTEKKGKSSLGKEQDNTAKPSAEVSHAECNIL